MKFRVVVVGKKEKYAITVSVETEDVEIAKQLQKYADKNKFVFRMELL